MYANQENHLSNKGYSNPRPLPVRRILLPEELDKQRFFP